MAQAFNINARINLSGPYNVQPVVRGIRSQVEGIPASLDFKLPPRSTQALGGLGQDALQLASNMGSVEKAVRLVGKAMGGVRFDPGSSAGVDDLLKRYKSLESALKSARREMEGFKSQSELAGEVFGVTARRVGAIIVAAQAFRTISSSFQAALRSAVDFQHEMTRLGQIGDTTAQSVADVSKEIGRLASGLGTDSTQLARTSVTLRQAGLSAQETKTALDALAKTTLAPTFESLQSTTEGVIAMRQQFDVAASDVSARLGAINTVAGEFAVESEDLVTAIRKAGGAFRSASGDMVTGEQSFNQLLALFTSVRNTTRESADEIATGLRTIFARVQSNSVANSLKEMGVNLRYTREESQQFGRDVTGQFVGAYEAVRRLAAATQNLPTTDPRFSQIVEQLGGFRQISRVIPLLQQFGTAEKAYQVAQAGANSLTQDSAKAQDSFLVKLTKVKETFFDLIRTLTGNKALQDMADVFLKLTEGALRFGKSLEPIVPLIAAVAAAKTISSLTNFGRGVANTLADFRGAASRIGRSERIDPTTIRKREGGPVPGHGVGDKVPMWAEPGEFVLNRKASQKIGLAALYRWNAGGYDRSETHFQQGGSPRGGFPIMVEPGEFYFGREAVDRIGLSNLERANRTGEIPGEDPRTRLARKLKMIGGMGATVRKYAQGGETKDVDARKVLKNFPHSTPLLQPLDPRERLAIKLRAMGTFSDAYKDRTKFATGGLVSQRTLDFDRIRRARSLAVEGGSMQVDGVSRVRRRFEIDPLTGEPTARAKYYATSRAARYALGRGFPIPDKIRKLIGRQTGGTTEDVRLNLEELFGEDLPYILSLVQGDELRIPEGGGGQKAHKIFRKAAAKVYRSEDPLNPILRSIRGVEGHDTAKETHDAVELAVRQAKGGEQIGPGYLHDLGFRGVDLSVRKKLIDLVSARKHRRIGKAESGPSGDASSYAVRSSYDFSDASTESEGGLTAVERAVEEGLVERQTHTPVPKSNSAGNPEYGRNLVSKTDVADKTGVGARLRQRIGRGDARPREASTTVGLRNINEVAAEQVTANREAARLAVENSRKDADYDPEFRKSLAESKPGLRLNRSQADEDRRREADVALSALSAQFPLSQASKRTTVKQVSGQSAHPKVQKALDEASKKVDASMSEGWGKWVEDMVAAVSQDSVKTLRDHFFKQARDVQNGGAERTIEQYLGSPESEALGVDKDELVRQVQAGTKTTATGRTHYSIERNQPLGRQLALAAVASQLGVSSSTNFGRTDLPFAGPVTPRVELPPQAIRDEPPFQPGSFGVGAGRSAETTAGGGRGRGSGRPRTAAGGSEPPNDPRWIRELLAAIGRLDKTISGSTRDVAQARTTSPDERPIRTRRPRTSEDREAVSPSLLQRPGPAVGPRTFTAPDGRTYATSRSIPGTLTAYGAHSADAVPGVVKPASFGSERAFERNVRSKLRTPDEDAHPQREFGPFSVEPGDQDAARPRRSARPGGRIRLEDTDREFYERLFGKPIAPPIPHRIGLPSPYRELPNLTDERFLHGEGPIADVAGLFRGGPIAPASQVVAASSGEYGLQNPIHQDVVQEGLVNARKQLVEHFRRRLENRARSEEVAGSTRSVRSGTRQAGRLADRFLRENPLPAINDNGGLVYRPELPNFRDIYAGVGGRLRQAGSLVGRGVSAARGLAATEINLPRLRLPSFLTRESTPAQLARRERLGKFTNGAALGLYAVTAASSYLNDQFGSQDPNDVEALKRSKSTAGFTGAVSGATIGAQLGTMAGGPYGAAIGGVVGGLLGLSGSLTSIDKQIRQVKIDQSLKELGRALDAASRDIGSKGVRDVNARVEDVRSQAVLQTSDAGDNWVNKISDVLSDYLGGSASSSIRFAASTMGVPDIASIGGLATAGGRAAGILGADQNAFSNNAREREQARLAASQAKERDLLSPMIPQLRHSLEGLASTIQLDPSDVRKTSGGDESARRGRREALLNQGGGRQLIETISRIERVPIEQVVREFDNALVRSNQSKIVEKGTAQTAVDSDLQARRFDRLGSALDAAAASLKKFQTATDAIESLAQGRVGQAAVSGVAENATLGGIDSEGVRNATSLARTSLGDVGSGVVDRFASTIEEIDKARRELPKRLVDASKGSNFSEDTIIGDLSDAFEGFSTDMRSKLQTKLDTIDPKTVLQELSTNPDKLGQNIADAVFKETEAVWTGIVRRLEEAPQRLTADLSRSSLLQNQAGVARDRVADSRLGLARSRLDLINADTGQTRELGLDVLNAPFVERQRRLAPNADGLSADSIATRLREVNKLALEQGGRATDVNLPGRERTQAQVEFAKLTNEAGNLQKALEGLSDSSSRLSNIQAKIAEAERLRGSQLSVAERLLTGDASTRRDFSRGVQGAQAAAAQGDFTGFNPRQIQLVLDALKSLGEVKFTEGPLRGFTGDEAARTLVTRSSPFVAAAAGIPGLNAVPTDRQIVGLKGQAVGVQGEAVKASENLASIQEGLSRNFFDRITTGFDKFFKDADRKLAEADVKDRQSARDTAEVSERKSRSQLFTAARLTDQFGTVEAARKLSTSPDITNLARSNSDLQRLTKVVGPGGAFQAASKEIDRKGTVFGVDVKPQAAISNVDRASDREAFLTAERTRLSGLAPQISERTGLSHEEVQSGTTEYLGRLRSHIEQGRLPNQGFDANAQFLGSFRRTAGEAQQKALEDSNKTRDTLAFDVYGDRRQSSLNAVDRAASHRFDVEEAVKSIPGVQSFQQAQDEFVAAQEKLAEATRKAAQAEDQLAKVRESEPTQYKAVGGPILSTRFRRKHTDTVPAMLTPGEFVVNARQSARHRDVLNAINDGHFGPSNNQIARITNERLTRREQGSYRQRRLRRLNDLVGPPKAEDRRFLRGIRGGFSREDNRATGDYVQSYINQYLSQFMMGFAGGGMVPRGTDDVPAMLTRGEYVVPRQTAQSHLSLLQNLKPEYRATGGSVGVQDDNQTRGADSSSGNGLEALPARLESTIRSLERSLQPIVELPRSFEDFARSQRDLGNELAAWTTSANALSKSLAPFNDAAVKLAQVLSQVSIPSTIQIQTQHRVEVLINGAQVLAAIKGDMAEEVTRQVVGKLQGEVRKIIQEMPAV